MGRIANGPPIVVAMAAESNHERQRRELRLRIGRARRRIDRRVRRLFSWPRLAAWAWGELKDLWAESSPRPRDEPTCEPDHDGT